MKFAGKVLEKLNLFMASKMVKRIFVLFPVIFLMILWGCFLVTAKLIDLEYSIIVPRMCAITAVIIFLFTMPLLSVKKRLHTTLFVLSIFLFVSYALLQILEFYNFMTIGENFGLNFYATATDIDLLLEFAPGQKKQILACIIFLVVNAVLFVVASCQISTLLKKQRSFLYPLCSLLLLIGTLFFCQNPVVNFFRMLNTHLFSTWSIFMDDNDIKINAEDLKKHGITYCETSKKDLTIYSKGNGKNLVLIILESMEDSFLDEERFPGLTPNLNKLKKSPRTIYFDNIVDAAGFTSAAVFQIMFGMPPSPLLTPSGGVAAAHTQYLNCFVSLPYLFTKAGYQWHHIEHYCSLRDILISENAKVYSSPEKSRDHHTYQQAWEIFSNGIKSASYPASPLAISLVTIDGHFPNGKVDADTLKYPNKAALGKNFSKHQLMDAIYNTDHHLGNLINKILSSPEGKNTTIIITNDHRFMGNVDKLLPQKPRKNIFFIINAAPEKVISTAGCQLDIPATILDLFKIKSNYSFPYGQSLLTPGLSNSNSKIFCKERNFLQFNKMILAKNKIVTGKTSVNANTIRVKTHNNAVLMDCFGQEVRLDEKDTSLLVINLDEEKSIQYASYWMKHGFSFATINKQAENCFKDKKSYIFIAGCASPNMSHLIKTAKLSPPTIKQGWVLMYKHKNGSVKAICAPRLKQMQLDVSDIFQAPEDDVKTSIKHLY